MSRPTSLTLRLTLLFCAVATVVFLAFGWTIERSIDDHFEAQDSKELSVVARAVKQSLTTLQSNDNLDAIKQRFDDMLVGHHNPLLYISDGAGNPVYNSTKVDLSQVPLPHSNHLSHSNIRQWSDGKHHYRVLIQQFTGRNNGPYTIIIAVAIDFHLQFLSHFRHTLWLMVVGGILIMAVMGWIAVRHGHKPLHKIVDQISRISTNELNNRLAPDTVPTELTELAISFNELLQRMEEAFTRLSNFSADIAHELRTPVTNLMTQTQVALSQARSTDEYQEILYSNMEEYERMAQMIGDMLFLAKADSGQHPPHTEAINLKDEIANLFDYYEAWAEESQVSLIQEGEARVFGDRLMLRRALSNLLSNAIRHTPAGNKVSIKLGNSEGDVFIAVQNPGSAIPPEHLNKLFDRFYRTDPSRRRSGEGAGLGLAIVKSIIEAHGGTITVSSDEIKTEFRITLPGIMVFAKTAHSQD
ncbi:MAG TPA: heavy metal sensor histidine kinase [Candidatus Tenderia electrophaga]|uniref:Sensor protein n=1 Tax=Candidatus Tenderia electrophaga TaxID=1748243 RepID=A0A832J407_9GAMM|nr:heavy metal sensor histidine kinase [Candidatus Tenderia electrophaga]